MGPTPLEQYFKFDEQDLKTNRIGRLTDKQSKTLLADRKSSKGCSSFLGVVLIIISMIFPIIFIPIGYFLIQDGEIGGAVGGFVGATVWFLAFGGIGISMFASGMNKNDTKIVLKNAGGPINIVGVERHTSGEHHSTYIQMILHIGHERFEVEDDIGDCLIQGNHYNIYYVENLDGTEQKILSIEQVMA
jgi:hypothetical protein